MFELKKNYKLCKTCSWNGPFECWVWLGECQKSNFKLLCNYKAHLKVTKEKNCASCGKKVGEKTFVVFPNGVIAHHTCVNN